MTLARRMTIKIAALAATLVVLAATAAWGMLAAQTSVRIARDEYIELGMILTIDEHLVAARTVVTAGAKLEDAAVHLAAGLHELQALLDFQDQQYRDIVPHEEEEEAFLLALQADLERVSLLFGADAAELEVDRVLAGLGAAKAVLEKLAGEMDDTIASAQHESNRAIQTTLAIVGLVSLVAITATILINVAQYRSVIVPIRRLRDGVRRIASGQFNKRLQFTGDDDFTQLARDFNQMAAELDDLYRDLERRVQEKSRELVRSERLASVGYLAAGVAHEINNPLNIISGYAELTLRQIRRAAGTPAQEETAKALRIIRDESFRCKEIIEKLLSLSSGGEADRERVSLAQVVDEVATMLGSLKQYRRRKVAIRLEQDDGLYVLGNETELKQVVLNLAINALEAVRPEVGEVCFDVRRVNGTVELVVSDNGRGLTDEVREHVFEPFFTQRAGADGRGLGLGLSITHAIVGSHGGRISVSSEGSGKGSRFVVELPAYSRESKTK